MVRPVRPPCVEAVTALGFGSRCVRARSSDTSRYAYAAAYLATSLVFIAPLLVTLALKVNSLVGTDRASSSLSLVAATGSLVALVANPFFGRLSDRTTSRWGMRRPWIVGGLAGGSLGILIVARAQGVWVVLIGWCLAQLFFNAMLAAMVAVLPDQVPIGKRGTVAGILGVCLPDRVGGRHVRGEGLHRHPLSRFFCARRATTAHLASD